MFPTSPRSLRDPETLARRRAQLDPAAPFVAFAASLRMEGLEVPDFDPINGAAGVRLLFLLEKPGPMTSPRGRGRREGSGLISPDNDDPTAEAAFGALVIGGVDRAQVAFWNVIPWWNGTIHVTAPELRAGLAELGRLVELLPDLRGVVLVGVKAARAEEALRARNLATFRSAHPSSQVRAAFPDRWRAIPGVWAEAARACGAIHRAGVGRV